MTRQHRITRIGITSAANIGMAVGAGAGFVIGAVAGIVGGFVSALLGSTIAPEFARFGLVMLVMMPVALALFYLVLGGVGAALSALLFNLAAGSLGGLEIDSEDTSGTPSSRAPGGFDSIPPIGPTLPPYA